MPGMYKVMEQLRQVSFLIGIVLNGSQESRQRTVQNLNLGKHIDILISSGEAGIKKPDARIFALALSRLGIQASAAWFVGDHPLNDILGAQWAGLQAIWLKGFHEWPANVPGPAWEVDSLYEIVDIITQHHRQRLFRAKNMR
jgi:putative hydrolase of the HAD superfamily